MQDNLWGFGINIWGAGIAFFSGWGERRGFNCV